MTCGECKKDFRLQELTLFIQHKALNSCRYFISPTQVHIDSGTLCTNNCSQNPGIATIIVLTLFSSLNNQGLAFTTHEAQFRREEKGGKGDHQREDEDEEGDVRSSKDRSYASLGSPSVSGSGQVGNQHVYFVIKHQNSPVLYEAARIKTWSSLRRSQKRAPLKARSSLRWT